MNGAEDGGKWQGFPGFRNYARDQSRYYAYPSGHTATAVSTLTVLLENYTEHRWLAPVGGTMVGLLMVALTNVQSHWPSDYPLAILIGYTSGHSVAEHARMQERTYSRTAASRRRWQALGVTPECNGSGCGLSQRWVF